MTEIDQGPPPPQGYALIEVLFLGLLLIPILNLLTSVFKTASNAFSANDANSEASREAKVVALRIADLLRTASFGTLRVQPTSTWIPPASGTDYHKVRFKALAEVPGHVSALDAERGFDFELDSGELRNSIDDDGDGLADEGRVKFVLPGGEQIPIATNVEAFALRFVGRIATITLQHSAKDATGKVHRSKQTLTVNLVNN